jgi:hypothetical protein
MLGVRGTRSFADKTKCAGDCTELNGIRSFGLDFGYLWPLPLLHFGPRVGGGWAREPRRSVRSNAPSLVRSWRSTNAPLGPAAVATCALGATPARATTTVSI